MSKIKTFDEFLATKYTDIYQHTEVTILQEITEAGEAYSEYRMKAELEQVVMPKALDTYIKEKHTKEERIGFEECVGFIDGFNKAIEIIKK